MCLAYITAVKREPETILLYAGILSLPLGVTAPHAAVAPLSSSPSAGLDGAARAAALAQALIAASFSCTSQLELQAVDSARASESSRFIRLRMARCLRSVCRRSCQQHAVRVAKGATHPTVLAKIEQHGVERLGDRASSVLRHRD